MSGAGLRPRPIVALRSAKGFLPCWARVSDPALSRDRRSPRCARRRDSTDEDSTAPEVFPR